MINDIRILQGAQALNELQKRHLMPRGEILALAQNLKGEEGLAIAETITKAWQAFQDMPFTYATENTPDPLARMHYFLGGWDWWITEKDGDAEEAQFFGFVKSGLCPQGELGYISPEEITQVGAELDLYFTPAPLSTFKK
jgi:hypothetical protein